MFKCEREKEDEGKTLCCLGEEINSPKNKRNTKIQKRCREIAYEIFMFNSQRAPTHFRHFPGKLHSIPS